MVRTCPPPTWMWTPISSGGCYASSGQTSPRCPAPLSPRVGQRARAPGTDLLSRLPRRATAASLVEHEQKWLPVLARGLPLPVPVPVFVGRPGCGYAWSWSVVPFLQGRAARMQDLNAPAGAALGGFLGALHRPAPAEAPANPVRGVPLLAREAAFLDNLRLVTDARLLSTAAAALDIWHTAVSAAQFAGPPVWLHGDLHPSNVLVDDGRVCGVIDFGDLTAGDPATDLHRAGCSPTSLPAPPSGAPTSRRLDMRSTRLSAFALAAGLFTLPWRSSLTLQTTQ